MTQIFLEKAFGTIGFELFNESLEPFGPDGGFLYGQIEQLGALAGQAPLNIQACRLSEKYGSQGYLLDLGDPQDLFGYPIRFFGDEPILDGHLPLDGFLGDFIESMSSSSGNPNSSGIPLQEFRRDCPPGWSPGLPDYPLRLFFDKLKLWYQIFDGADELVGPLVAGRLQGKAQRLALQLRLPRPDGGVDVGSDALVRLSVDEVRDPANPSIILQNSIPSGIQSLCNSLRDAFGFSDQELVSKNIEDFMEFRRGRMAFSEFSIEFDMRLEEATTRAGFEINDVAKFYLFFKAAQLPVKLVDDIKLQIQGDLRRFQEARALALRLVRRAQEHHDSYFMGDEEDEWDDSWDDPWFGEAYWQEDAEYWPEEWPEDSEAWHDEDYYGEEEYYDAESREPSEPSSTPATSASPPQTSSASASAAQTSRDESFPMQKGKGRSCSTCGSRWHSAAYCPVNTGKGKGQAKGSPPGYSGGKGGHSNKGGYGKGYGKPRYSKGGSGYGKGKGKKGKSKWSPYRGFGKGGFGKKGGSGYGGGNYFGFSDKQLNDSFHGLPPRSSPLKKKHVRFEDDEHDTILHLNRPKASLSNDVHNICPEPPSEDQASTSATEKRLDFSFALGIFSSLESYHTVKGDKRRGLLVDPGAASGLVGSETLRDLLSVLPTEKQQAVTWNHEKQHSVSGISGTPESTMGEVTIPLTLSGAHGAYRADVLGGDGSLCPALLGNPALRRQRAAILTDYFENGDGVLVVQKPDQERHYLRILLTDSGHYLLPVDEHCDVTEQDASKVGEQLGMFTSAIRAKWNDVRHCFLQRPSCSTPERERCEPQEKAGQGSSDNSPSTFSTTTSSTREPSCESRAQKTVKEGTTFTTMEDSMLTSSDTACTTTEERMTTASEVKAGCLAPEGRELTLEVNSSGSDSLAMITASRSWRIHQIDKVDWRLTHGQWKSTTWSGTIAYHDGFCSRLMGRLIYPWTSFSSLVNVRHRYDLYHDELKGD